MHNLDEMTIEQLRMEVKELRAENKKILNSKIELCSLCTSISKSDNEKLEESEISIISILNNTNAVIYIKDLVGKYTFVNKRYAKLFHTNNDEVKDKTDYDFFPKEYADKFKENDKKIIETLESIEFEEEVVHDDGVHNYISLKFPIFKKMTGELCGICGISTDITERKKIEIEKDKAIEELKDSLDKVKQLNELLPFYIQPGRSLQFCTSCCKIRNENGSWCTMEEYIKENSNIKLVNATCPQCNVSD